LGPERRRYSGGRRRRHDRLQLLLRSARSATPRRSRRPRRRRRERRLLEQVREYVSRELQRINRQFESHETIKRFRLVPVEFTGENDLLTISLKHERRNVAERFTDRIEGKYAAAEESEEQEAAA